ncbi:alpha/beta hydrolase [Pseudonocardia sp. GCM10023141]|uniref:alpha/beta hydrolase n=1 Tax=Pseudonocardia sp. GCM10023141 TaxID=3252653 RepID=UPI003611B3B2
MRNPLTRALVVLAVTAVAVTSCAGQPQPQAASPPPAWEACGAGLDCATVQVPVDPAQPEGRSVGIALVRHRATDPARRLGVLLYNPGGPGAPTTEFIQTLGVSRIASDAVAARYDVVGMDPRGVGRSEPVRCLSDAEREQNLAADLDPTLSGGLPQPEVVAAARTLAQGCAAGVAPDLLGHLSTDVVAADIDRVRAALGEERISFFGQSYGTLLGATYATLFPQRVDRMVLDAPVDPARWRADPLGATVEQALGGEELLDLWFASCTAAGPACPFGAGDPAAAFDALVVALERNPITVAPTGPAPGGRLDGAGVLIAARTAVFDRMLWPVLTAGLVAAQRGDGALLLALATAPNRTPDGSPSGLVEANAAVNCLDRAVPTDLGAHDRNAAEIKAKVHRFGSISGYLLLPCAFWPVHGSAAAPPTAAGAPPILVIGGRSDSQTPYPWAVTMAAGIPSATLLTREGVGHGSYRSSGPCIDQRVDAYLLSAALPDPGATCQQEPPASAALPPH